MSQSQGHSAVNSARGQHWTGSIAITGMLVGGALIYANKNTAGFISLGVGIGFIILSALGRKVVEWKNKPKEIE